MQKVKPIIRLLESQDIPQIAEAFEKIGWNKPASQYERYLMEQVTKLRDVYVAFVEEQFAGYLTICWTSSYPAFREAKTSEIVDFNVLPKFQRQGIGTQLMDRAENEIAKRGPIAGIGVGLYPNYGAAQRMYVLRGYVPDGRGLYQNDHFPKHGEQITVDDDLALYFTKELK
ncbi:MAG TPA: GNAT family N-acetyltransferase [Anaerolineales bacterium]|nr:GNAT family N-acetyltransferase [Anaerolineales bacterium]